MIGHPTVDALITAAAAVLRGWVLAFYGRKVRLKIGEIEAEGRTIEEIERLLRRAATFQDIGHLH